MEKQYEILSSFSYDGKFYTKANESEVGALPPEFLSALLKVKAVKLKEAPHVHEPEIVLAEVVAVPPVSEKQQQFRYIEPLDGEPYQIPVEEEE